MQTTKIALVENPVSVPYVIFSPFFHLPFLPKVEWSKSINIFEGF